MSREHEEAIFVGSMTKIGKIVEKNLGLISISFFFNILRDEWVGIKFANSIKGTMPFVYFDTLQKKEEDEDHLCKEKI